MRGLLRAALTVLVAMLATGGGVQAQQNVLPGVTQQAPVLIVNTDRLYLETRYGQRIASTLAEEAEALKAENDRIVAALTQEERSLTERRPEMDVALFQQEAAAFDAKVQEIRRARDAKEAELQANRATARNAFEEATREVLGRLMLEMGAYVILDGRSVILAVRSIDVTDDAIARIDSVLGDGTPGSEGQ